jgi:hypothetical protein
MRSPSGTVRFFVLAGSTALALAVPAFAEEKAAKVTIEESGIILHPGTKLSRDDQQELNEVLKKYDKSLYKIDIYKNGEKKKSLGQLSDVCLDRAVVAEVAQTTGNSNRTLQIITATNPQRTPDSTVNPVQTPGSTVNPVRSPSSTVNPVRTPSSTVNPVRTPSATTNPQHSPSATTNPQQQTPCVPDEKAAKELIERLKPILEKYSKK